MWSFGTEAQQSENLPHVGQSLMSTVVDNWRLLRQRNVDNAAQAERLETVFSGVIEQFEKTHDQYSRLQESIESLPSLKQSISKLNDDLESIGDAVARVEIIHDKLLKLRNENIVKTYEDACRADLEAHRVRLFTEHQKHKAYVTSTRQKLLEKEMAARKQHFEAEFEQALKKFSQQDITSPAPQSTPQEASISLQLAPPPMPTAKVSKLPPVPAEVEALVDLYYNNGERMSPEGHDAEDLP